MSKQEKQEGDFKLKKPKAKQLGKANEVIKVDLKKPEPEAPIKVDLAIPKQEVVEEKVEDKQEESVYSTEEQPVIQEITKQEVAQEVSEVTQELQQAVIETKETGKALPVCFVSTTACCSS